MVRTRAQRRRERCLREARARRIVHRFSGGYDLDFEMWLVPRIADNLKMCSKDCCGNPRRGRHGNKVSRLTLQERRALLEVIDQ